MIFLNSSRETTLASHDAVIRPDLSGHVVLLTGPVLPDVRVPIGEPVGVSVTLGKTDAPSTDALVDRYALIASQPEGPEARVREVLADLVVDSADPRGRARAGADPGLGARRARSGGGRSSRAPANDAGRSPWCCRWW